MTDELQTGCHRHPDARNVLDCRKCGLRVCHECRVSHYAGTLAIPYCRKCDAKLRRARQLRKLTPSLGIFAVIVLVVVALQYGGGMAGGPGSEEFAEMSSEPLFVQGVDATVEEALEVTIAETGRPGLLVTIKLRNRGSSMVPLHPNPPTEDADDGSGTWALWYLARGAGEDDDEILNVGPVLVGDAARIGLGAERGKPPEYAPPAIDALARMRGTLAADSSTTVIAVLTDLDSIAALRSGEQLRLAYEWWDPTEVGIHLIAPLSVSSVTG